MELGAGAVIPLPGRDARIFLRVGATDMRKAINGLSVLAQEQIAQDPFSGALFVFCNRRRDLIKILYWDRNGFCLWQKRLEQDRFPWPQSGNAHREVTPQQLEWLLDGIDFRKQHKQLAFSRAG